MDRRDRDRDRSRSRSRDRSDRRPSAFISEDPEELKKKLFIGNLFYEVNYCVSAHLIFDIENTLYSQNCDDK